MNYYWISINNEQVSTVAYAPVGTPVSHRLIDMLDANETVPFSLELHEIIENNGIKKGARSDIFYDYQPNSLAWPIMSERMYTIIASHLTGFEHIVWKRIQIVGKSISFPYYIPMFTIQLETLDNNNSVIVPSSGIVLKPCFKKDLLRNLSVFYLPSTFWRVTTQLFINDNIRRELLKEKIKGIEFSKARVV